MIRLINKKVVLRFKQWSRKSYAAFRSIGRHVTIGTLKNILADSLLGKQQNLIPLTTTACQEEIKNEERRKIF